MKNQMIKMSVLLIVTTMLFTGCGGAAGTPENSTTDANLEMEVSVVDNEISTQEETEIEVAIAVVENTEVEERQAEENQELEDQEKPKEPQEPEKPEEPVKPQEPEEPKHQHKYTGVVTKEPGCYYVRKDGEMTYTCSCGDSYVEVLEFLPCSDLSDGIRVTVREPDCQHQGRTCEHCKYCGQELYPGTLPETEHIPSEWLEIPSQGKKYKVCVNCGITLEKELLEQIESMMKMVLR